MSARILLLLCALVACSEPTAAGNVAARRAGPLFLWGDVDCDGAVTNRDADLVLRHAVGLSIAPYDTLPGDVDANAVVNTRDALIIKSYVAGYDVSPFRVGQFMPNSPCAMPDLR
jgi:hypothetical protein